MPELPEVETIKRELENAVVGKKIRKVCVYNAKVLRGVSASAFMRSLRGAAIKKVLRRAKVLILELSSGKCLVLHLKMTGQLIYPGSGVKSRISFYFSDGTALDFNDQRLFGEARLLDDWRSFKFIRGLGPEPLDLTRTEFSRMLDAKKTKIKPLLLDQGFISGIGNLYAAESLFRAGISPLRQAQSLSEKERATLLRALTTVLKEAIRYKGSSVDEYVQLSGTPGGYAAHHKVYGRQGKPCLICGSPIQRIALGGRGTYFCPHCQK
ncbi:MAG: bifunctional DNA-formamidopyrimidine glycosylase/DNA-(apurinic or apyrimidinic site) lyase [Candidatus Omnitrophica bacterium]|nr:bifunctional DNA-formamidopyrimidine glycosylase/DNA-(apurinic or apyrimidinic site) lyase [Candidatus Omnitrophota bacterium]